MKDRKVNQETIKKFNSGRKQLSFRNDYLGLNKHGIVVEYIPGSSFSLVHYTSALI